MKKIPIEQAVGQQLVHDLTSIMSDGFKGVRFKRNHVVQAEDLETLRDMGKNHLYVWEDCDRDLIHEEDAAKQLAEQILLCEASAQSLYAGDISEGKISLHARHDGILSLNLSALYELNQLPDWTMPTSMNLLPVHRNDVVAALRIVPLATHFSNVDAACQLVKEQQPLLQVIPYRTLRVGIMITGNEVYEGRIKDAFEPILRRKLKAFPSIICEVRKCPDDLKKLCKNIEELSKICDLLLLTGGMSVDPDDLTPTAIKRMATTLITQGVPMQPGNMLTIAEGINNTVLLGIPGASMHAPATSLDIFLPRIFADMLPTAAEISALAIGGLRSPNYHCWPTLPLRELQADFSDISEDLHMNSGDSCCCCGDSSKTTESAHRHHELQQSSDCAYRVGILTISDKGSRGERIDKSGPAIQEILREQASLWQIEKQALVADEPIEINKFFEAAVSEGMDLVLTTGGTGCGPRDNTPEVTKDFCDRLAPGIAEFMRLEGLKHTESAMLSRAICGIKKETLIVNLPGSPKAIEEVLPATLKLLKHALKTLKQPQHDCHIASK